uniref:Secretory calcium-binding phosphoprotein 1 n=1 Tax=Erpetoichthys calabaricus TaxID=27687 RepID=A0A8C4SVH8_ERPCA
MKAALITLCLLSAVYTVPVSSSSDLSHLKLSFFVSTVILQYKNIRPVHDHHPFYCYLQSDSDENGNTRDDSRDNENANRRRVQIFKVSHESVEDSSISTDEEDGQGLDSSNGDTQEEATGGDNVSDNGESSEPDEDDSHEGQPKAKGCTSDEDNSCPDDSDEYVFEGIGDDSHQSNENSLMNDVDPEPPRQW